MGDLDDLGARSDRRLELVDQILLGGRRNLERDLLQDDALPAHPLPPGGQHTPVILVADDDLVAGLEVQPQNHDFVGFRSVPGDRHLLGIAAEILGQVAPHALDAWLEHPPHVIDRELIAELEVPDHLVEHVGRRRRAAAVVEVDHGAIDVESPLDFRPVRLVVRQGVRGTGSGDLGRPHHPADGVIPEHGECGSGTGEGGEEGAAGSHAASTGWAGQAANSSDSGRGAQGLWGGSGI